MKDLYKISDQYTLDLTKGGMIDLKGNLTGITAYQERFLKYLILNENSICISENLHKFIYRGEDIPKRTPSFYSELIKLCPDLRSRISTHRVEYMDYGYTFKLSNHISQLAKDMAESEITTNDLQKIGQNLIEDNIEELKKILTPNHRTVLRILLAYHDKPLSYKAIIQHSYAYATPDNPPLKNTRDIIGICNDFLDVIPGFDEFLQPIYVNTVGYMFQKHPEDTEAELAPKETDSISSVFTDSAIKPGGYPARNQLDSSYIYIGDNTYLNLKHQFAIKYEEDQTITTIPLLPQMVSFLEPLIKKSPIAVSKATLCWAVYGNYDISQEESLYHIKKKLGLLIPSMKKSIKPKYGFGYSFVLPEEDEHS